jgi:hypothetical protein
MKKLPLILLLLTSSALFAQTGNTGVVTGRVLGLNGLPAAGVRVALAAPNTDGKIVFDVLIGLTLTDETGHYRIENIPPGRYGIVAGAVAEPTFYPGTTSAAGATIVAVQRGSTTAALSFALVTSNVPAYTSVNIAQLNRQLALPGQVISGRIVVDGPLISTFLPNLKVLFSVVAPGPASAAPPGRIGTSVNGSVLYSSSTDVKLDNHFRLELKPLPYRISVGRADNKPLAGFVVKSITLGTIDLMKNELKADTPITGEIIITLQPVPLTNPIKL